MRSPKTMTLALIIVERQFDEPIKRLACQRCVKKVRRGSDFLKAVYTKFLEASLIESCLVPHLMCILKTARKSESLSERDRRPASQGSVLLLKTVAHTMGRLPLYFSRERNSRDLNARNFTMLVEKGKCVKPFKVSIASSLLLVTL